MSYHYTECGLDNVIVEGLDIVKDHVGDDTVTIPAVGVLHRIIAEGIVTLPSKITGKELRFLRSEMGLTQTELAETLKVKLLTVSRWEREENQISDGSEMLVRLLAIEKLGLDSKLSVEAAASKVTHTPRTKPIIIDGSDPNNYHLAA